MAPTNKFAIGMGLFAVAIGTIPLWSALGYLPHGQQSADPAPNWMAALFGLMFFLAVVMVIVRSLTCAPYEQSGRLPATVPRALRAVYELMGMAVVASLALTFNWVAFGPGARHFSVSVMAGSAGAAKNGAGDAMGRVAFGIGAAMTRLFFGVALVSNMRRWFLRR